MAGWASQAVRRYLESQRIWVNLTVSLHEIRGERLMEGVFDDEEDDTDQGNEEAETS